MTDLLNPPKPEPTHIGCFNMTQQDIEQKAREIIARLGMGPFPIGNHKYSEARAAMCDAAEFIESQRQQIAEKDAEIERLRNDRGLLPVCKVDQELLAANATCRQQAEMIGILQAEVERHKSRVKELKDGLNKIIRYAQTSGDDKDWIYIAEAQKSINHPGETP